MTRPVLVLDGVGKAYVRGRERSNLRRALPGAAGRRLRGDVHTVLDGVDLELRAGQSLAVIGSNGAGKSTLLKIIAGVTDATSGAVTTRGRVAALIELGAGFHPDMTGRENVRFSAAVMGMSRRALARRTDEIVDFADIGGYLDTPVKRYSSGMLARLGFAVASSLDADVMVVDEVLSVGDAGFQHRCHERMRELRAGGTALLYVTHALWTIPAVADQAVLLAGARVAARGTPDEVVSAYRALEASTDDEPSGSGVADVRVDRTAIDPGEALCVTVDLELAEPLPHGRLLVSLHTPDMVSQSAVAAPPGALNRAGSRQVVCRLPGVPLQPGQYWVVATLQRDRRSPVVDDHRRTSLQVRGTPDGSADFGVLALPSAWDTSC